MATLLPLSCLPNFAASIDFIRWLKQTQQNGWHLLPLADSLQTPYRNQGIGLSPYFYDNRIPEDFQTWMITRDEFITKMHFWIYDYALFQALRRQIGTNKWWTWPEGLDGHQTTAVKTAHARLANEVNAYIDQQYFLYNEMLHLRRHALENEITLISDLPFYIARESALVWAHQKLFLLGEHATMRLESGVPSAPDEPFAEQYWGHPLYDWENNDLETVMNLLAERLAYCRGFSDLVRIDHANGFFKYGAMSPQHPAWNRKLQGPGKDAVVSLLHHLQNQHFGVYFEDIASDKMRLEQFMKEYEIAGSGVVTLMYNVEAQKPIPSRKIKDRDLDLKTLAGNRLVFSSTHDTPTLTGWLKKIPPDILARFIQINRLTGETTTDLALSVRRQLLETNARMIVVPWQDWQLEDWRLNVPGHEDQADWNHQVDISNHLKSLSLH